MEKRRYPRRPLTMAIILLALLIGIVSPIIQPYIRPLADSVVQYLQRP